MSPHRQAAYGSLLAGLSAILEARRQYVPRMLSWMTVLQAWPNLQRQQDAGEFLAFLLARASPSAYAGMWSARRAESTGVQVLDAGTLQAPLPIALHGTSLQDCIDNWERQRNIHAIVNTGGLLLLQLLRYRTSAGQPHKDYSSIPTQPGQAIGLPQFDSASGHQTHMISCTVHSVVCHLGTTLSSGHYITALSVPGSLLGRTAGWKWLICDDGHEPRLASARDLDVIACNAYIIGLVKS